MRFHVVPAVPAVPAVPEVCAVPAVPVVPVPEVCMVPCGSELVPIPVWNCIEPHMRLVQLFSVFAVPQFQFGYSPELNQMWIYFGQDLGPILNLDLDFGSRIRIVRHFALNQKIRFIIMYTRKKNFLKHILETLIFVQILVLNARASDFSSLLKVGHAVEHINHDIVVGLCSESLVRLSCYIYRADGKKVFDSHVNQTLNHELSEKTTRPRLSESQLGKIGILSL